MNVLWKKHFGISLFFSVFSFFFLRKFFLSSSSFTARCDGGVVEMVVTVV